MIMKTLEEKARAYDEALERASKLRFQNPFDTVSQMMEHVFPELKESEDKRIRKWLIDTIKSVPNDSIEWDVIDKSDVLAWLEKQGETDKTSYEIAEKQSEEKEYTFKSIPRLLDMIEPTDRAKAYCQKLIDTLAKEGYNTDAKIVEDVLKGWNGEDVPMAVMDEKQGEQKPVNDTDEDISILDMVEPKFKVGDWLCENEPNNYARFIQILKTSNAQGKERYRISRDIHNDEDVVELDFIEKYYHKFDIEDARDGDLIYVSTEEKGIQAIFHEYKNDTIFFHCYLCADFVQGGCMPIGSVELTYPLQKTHYNRFFEKMHEAGFEWDSVNKELKKIDTLLDLLNKMPSCITVNGIDYHFVLKKTALAYTAYYKALQIDSPILPIFWMTSLSPIDLLTEMFEILKEKGLLK